MAFSVVEERFMWILQPCFQKGKEISSSVPWISSGKLAAMDDGIWRLASGVTVAGEQGVSAVNHSAQ
jgi:hypothetical protein